MVIQVTVVSTVRMIIQATVVRVHGSDGIQVTMVKVVIQVTKVRVVVIVKQVTMVRVVIQVTAVKVSVMVIQEIMVRMEIQVNVVRVHGSDGNTRQCGKRSNTCR